MTDTNHIEVLRQLRAVSGGEVFLTPTDRAALDAAITALSARASAGEGGVDEHVRLLVGKLDQWRMRMSHNESYFGEPSGLMKATIAELAKAVDPIYPPKVEPADPLAGVTIHTVTVPFSDSTTTPPAHGDGEGDARAEFERWVAKRWGYSTERWADSGEYRYQNTRDWWQCWQAALTTRPTPEAQESTPPASGGVDVEKYNTLWLHECRRVLEDVATEMRATGRGDTRFVRLIETMPRLSTPSPTSARELPELPDHCEYLDVWVDGCHVERPAADLFYTADQMRAYAELARRGGS